MSASDDPARSCHFGYLAQRLEELDLLDGAVVLPLFSGGTELAVPVGVKWRGGYASFTEKRDARAALRVLADAPGW